MERDSHLAKWHMEAAGIRLPSLHKSTEQRLVYMLVDDIGQMSKPTLCYDIRSLLISNPPAPEGMVSGMNSQQTPILKIK